MLVLFLSPPLPQAVRTGTRGGRDCSGEERKLLVPPLVLGLGPEPEQLPSGTVGWVGLEGSGDQTKAPRLHCNFVHGSFTPLDSPPVKVGKPLVGQWIVYCIFRNAI